MSHLPSHPWPRHQGRRSRQKRLRRRPTLRFSPTAWAKLLFLRDRGPTEVGGFGITSAADLLCVHDLQLVTQHCTDSFVSFDDTAVADFFDRQIDLGRQPDQFGRIWIHTHPDDSAEPSAIDRDTFQRVFGNCDWAVMAILARGGECFAELHWRHGGPVSLTLDVDIDFSQPFLASDEAAWDAEYDTHVHAEHSPAHRHHGTHRRGLSAAYEEAHRNASPFRNGLFEDDALNTFCQHPLAWEMS